MGGAGFTLGLRRRLGPLDPDPLSNALVYMISAEDQEGTRLRIFAEAVRHKLNEAERADVNTFLRWVHLSATLHPELISMEIEKDAAGADVCAIFVDTGPALFAGDDENSNAALQSFAASWRPLTLMPGRPVVVLLWHPAKNATADNLVPRGGSSLLGAVDANLTLWRDDDVVTLSYTKLRSEHFEPIRFRLSRSH